MGDPYAWRSPQPDEPSVILPNGQTLDPLNLGAVLPKDPVNPLARLIVSATPTHKVRAATGGEVEVVEHPLPIATLLFIQRTKITWAKRIAKAKGELL